MPSLKDRLRRARLRASNALRRRRLAPRWVLLTLDGPIVELAPPSPLPDLPGPIERILERFLPDPPRNVASLRRTFEQLANDPRIEGVILRLDLTASAAIYQTLRGLIAGLRAAGKRVVAYAERFGPMSYYLACACDQIVMPPEAEWSVLGFEREYVFLKDALDWAGIGVEAVRVSPFKSAPDQFTQTDFSAESRAQAEALLDAVYETVVAGVAAGRRLSPETVRERIDQAPYKAEQALALGLIDATRYEDQLRDFVVPGAAADKPVEMPKGRRARIAAFIRDPRAALRRRRIRPALQTYGEAWRALLLPDIDWADQYVAVIQLEGSIIEGRSSPPSPIPLPFVGDRASGHESIAAAFRSAEHDDETAAIVLLVDSPGGSALASDLIAREVRRVRTKKPVVVYMNGVAASGGYYAAALANYIVAQPLTVTGSIGVFALKPTDGGVYDRLRVRRTTLSRGARAGLYGTAKGFDAEEREAVTQSIGRTYETFKRVVADGRKFDFEAVEPLAGGRVWTGAMALERKLVDALGDFQMALNKAAELGKIPADKRAPFWVVSTSRGFRLPAPFVDPAALARTVMDDTQQRIRRIVSGRAWARLPFDVSLFD
jgi:protease-4